MSVTLGAAAAGTVVAGEPTDEADEADWAAGRGTSAVPDGAAEAGLEFPLAALGTAEGARVVDGVTGAMTGYL